jgi:hypothetical protein
MIGGFNMKALYNCILDAAGFKPQTLEELKSVCCVSWYSFVDCDIWEKDGKYYTMYEALKIVEKENN